jgi:hypothetical protein
MKYLKKYNELLENKTIKNLFYSDDEENGFNSKDLEKLYDCLDSFFEHAESYSECIDYSKTPMEDLNELFSFLENSGINKYRLEIAFQLYKKQIVSNYEDENSLADLFLNYFCSEHLVGGGSFDPENDYNEVIIKYMYGYHNSSYGKLFILNHLTKDSKPEWFDNPQLDYPAGMVDLTPEQLVFKRWKELFIESVWNNSFGSGEYLNNLIKEYDLKAIPIDFLKIRKCFTASSSSLLINTIAIKDELIKMNGAPAHGTDTTNRLISKIKHDLEEVTGKRLGVKFEAITKILF